MSSSIKTLEVVCGVIIDNDGKLLACKRGPHHSQPCKWEFPGGKVEFSETREEALIREIWEELRLQINIESPLPNIIHKYPEFTISLHPFLCKRLSLNEPVLTDHSEIRWLDLNLNSVPELDWSEADIPILKHYINSL